MSVRTVDPQYFNYVITTPPGTPVDTPQVSTVVVPLTIIETCLLTIPTGHCGSTGWSLRYADAVILPWYQGQDWIVGDGQEFALDVNIELDGTVEFVTYNLGVYDHSHYVRLKQRVLPISAQVAPLNPVPLALVAPAA